VLNLLGHRLALLTLAATFVLILFGVGSFLTRFSSIPPPGESLTGLLMPVTHRVIGSLILGVAVLLAVRALGARARARARIVAPLRRATEGTR
jgi:hypothetical protein